MEHRISTPNERVWCTTQLAKLGFNNSIGRTHSWRFSIFYKKVPLKRLFFRAGVSGKKGEYSLHLYFQIMINNGISMLWRVELSLDYLNNGFRQLSGFCRWLVLVWYSDLSENNEEETGKTLNPECHLYFNLSSFPSIRCRNKGVQTIPSFYTQVIWFFFSIGTIFREVFGVLLTVADLAMIMPLTTWNWLDFRVVEKEKLLKQDLFAQPWWSRLW